MKTKVNNTENNKENKSLKKAISLIVLVITIIVLAILATAIIISISNTNIMTEAKSTTFKSDMQNFKYAYSLWLAGYISDNQEYDMTTINYLAGDTYLLNTILGGNVPDKYKSGLKVIEGKLVYDTDDEEQKEIVNELGMSTDDTTDTKFRAKYVLAHCNNLIDFECSVKESRGLLYISPNIEWKDFDDDSYDTELEAYAEEMLYDEAGNPRTTEEKEEYLITNLGYDTIEELLAAFGLTKEDIRDYDSWIDLAFATVGVGGVPLQVIYATYRLFGPDATLTDVQDIFAYLLNSDSYETMFPLEFYGNTYNSFDEFGQVWGLKENLSDLHKSKVMVYMIVAQLLGFPTDVIYTVTNGTDTKVSYIYTPSKTAVTLLSGINTITLTAPDGTSITKAYLPIEYNLTNCTSINTGCEVGTVYTSTILADLGYSLPDSISVTIGGNAYNGYTYNKSTGEISIPNEDIVGAVNISAVGV